MSLNDMALYMLKIVTLAQHITFWDICKMLRNEEHIYCKLFANFGPHTAEIRQVKKCNYFQLTLYSMDLNYCSPEIVPICVSTARI